MWVCWQKWWTRQWLSKRDEKVLTGIILVFKCWHWKIYALDFVRSRLLIIVLVNTISLLIDDTFPLVNIFYFMSQGQYWQVTWTVHKRWHWNLCHFLSCDLTHKIKQVWICASGRKDETWLQQHCFLAKVGMTHKENVCCDLSPRYVTAICHLVCPEKAKNATSTGTLCCHCG